MVVIIIYCAANSIKKYYFMVKDQCHKYYILSTYTLISTLIVHVITPPLRLQNGQEILIILLK